jgi:hypothetical protein
MQMASRGPPPAAEAGGIFSDGANPTPDPAITAAEDAFLAVTRGQSFEYTTEEKTPKGKVDVTVRVPGRPGYGTLGRPIFLRTNYFKINTGYEGTDATVQDRPLHKYTLEITPEVSAPKKRRVVQAILELRPLKNTTCATDYANIIVTTEPLDLKALGTTPNDEWREKIELPPPKENSGHGDGQAPAPDVVEKARERNSVTFRIKYEATFSLQHMIDYLRSNSAGAHYAGRNDVIQLLNIIMCKRPQGHEYVQKVGQNKFYPFGIHPATQRFQLGGGLEAHRGYFSSVRPTNYRLLVNLNVTSGAFYKPTWLPDLLAESRIGSKGDQEGFIRLLKVKAVYKKDGEEKPFMTKIKTICGFAHRPVRYGNAKQVTFEYEDRRQSPPYKHKISVFDYFKNVHGIELQRPDPVLNVGTSKDPQYLPMELCTVLDGQPYRRLLSGDQTSEMITFAARHPNANAMSIAGTQESPGYGLRLFQLAGSPGSDAQADSVKPFGFSVDTRMIAVPGRVLRSPRVTYKGKNPNVQRGSWNCANQVFASPGRLGNWQALVINLNGPRGNALINPKPDGDMLAPEALFKELERSLKSYGITMSDRLQTDTITLDALTVSNREGNDSKVRGAFERAKSRKVNMLFIVIPNVDRWLYARIKFHGDIVTGIHTINAVGNKLQKPRGQGMYLGNLALKFNIKGNGVSHKVPNVLTKPLDNNTMLVGIDVTHPSPGSSKTAPSIACAVASVDEHLFQWPGSVRTQTGRQEMVAGLEEMVLERLSLWQKKHQNKLPTKIVIYRDGVSEGQYALVLKYELPSFEAAFAKKYGKKEQWPKVSIIVVGKRHHTRFYPTCKEDADFNPQTGKGSWNPQPGTVVDRGIAGKILREFWLQAHQGLQGTARPAHYVVIKDDIGFEADELEQFTHSLCYLFNRATKAVSICPPAYYADLLCERGRAYLFSVLAENNAPDDSSVSSAASHLEWTGGVHDNLKDSTWYI